MSAIPWKKGVKDGGHYFGATIIDNILNTVIYSEDACKRIYKLFIKKKYNQTPTSQISWPCPVKKRDHDYITVISQTSHKFEVIIKTSQ